MSLLSESGKVMTVKVWNNLDYTSEGYCCSMTQQPAFVTLHIFCKPESPIWICILNVATLHSWMTLNDLKYSQQLRGFLLCVHFSQVFAEVLRNKYGSMFSHVYTNLLVAVVWKSAMMSYLSMNNLRLFHTSIFEDWKHCCNINNRTSMCSNMQSSIKMHNSQL